MGVSTSRVGHARDVVRKIVPRCFADGWAVAASRSFEWQLSTKSSQWPSALKNALVTLAVAQDTAAHLQLTNGPFRNGRPPGNNIFGHSSRKDALSSFA